MKTVTERAAQGDVFFRKVKAIPDGFAKQKRSGPIVVAHSETGHNHVMTMERTKAYRLPDSIMDIFLAVERGDVLEHGGHDLRQLATLRRLWRGPTFRFCRSLPHDRYYSWHSNSI